MRGRLLRALMVALLTAALITPGLAQAGGVAPLSKGQEVGIVLGVVAIAAVLVFIVYRTTHRHATLTGCVTTQGSRFALQTDGDRRLVPLTGSTSDLKAGEHARLTGKKHKDGFEIQKPPKDLGVCRQ